MTNKSDLKEKVTHGTPMFPFCVYQDKFQTKNIPFHWHEELEIIYMADGEGKFQIDSNEYHLSSNQALIVNNGAIHSAISIENAFCFFTLFHLKMLQSRYEDKCQINYIDPILNNNVNLNLFLSGTHSWHKLVIEQIKLLIKYQKEKPKGYELMIKSALFRVFYEIINNINIYKCKNENIPKIKHVKKALNYIHTNYNKNITSREIAEKVNLSSYYFCRIFKSITGKTPIEYLNFFRINQASNMLRKYSNKNILNIALDVGFNNYSYFIRTFKKFKNCTPNEYRETYIS